MMKNTIAVALTLFLSGIVFAQQARQFPYHLSLTGDSKPDAITEYFGVANLPVPDYRYSEDGIALTYEVDGEEQTFTGFALDDLEFTSQFGIIVEFTYAMIDGHSFNGRYGDGLSMFLYDSNKNFEIGGHGASLGYTYRNQDETHRNIPGLNGGYLGVGLDVYGDFKARSQFYAERREGIYYNWPETSSHVTVRGAQYKNDRYKGYPVLYSINASKVWKTNRARLDFDTGDYDYHEEQYYKNFDMRTGYELGEIVYNKVIVTVLPDHDEEGSSVEVKVKDKVGEGVVVQKFFYPNTFKTRDQYGDLYDFETQIPDNFKIGFAAGTGGAYQVHLIKDVWVKLPYQPETEDISAVFCMGDNNNDGRMVRFDPYEESYFYSGSVSNPTSGNTRNFIDYDSFRFEDEDGFELNERNPFEYTEPNVGTWEYDGVRTVTFTASRDDLAEGEYSIYFSAKGVDKGPNNGPFGEEVYRSRPTKLTVVVSRCKKLINPLLPIRIKVKEAED